MFLKLDFLIYSFWFKNVIHNSKKKKCNEVMAVYIVLSVVNGVFVVKTKLGFFQAVLYSAFPKQKKNEKRKNLSSC